MCRSMADIRSTAAEIRRGKKKIEERRKEGKKLQGKNIMAPLLHRAAIITGWVAIPIGLPKEPPAAHCLVDKTGYG